MVHNSVAFTAWTIQVIIIWNYRSAFNSFLRMWKRQYYVYFYDVWFVCFYESWWGPSGADRTLVATMLAPWTLLTGYMLYMKMRERTINLNQEENLVSYFLVTNLLVWMISASLWFLDNISLRLHAKMLGKYHICRTVGGQQHGNCIGPPDSGRRK